ncbi:MAG TPA: hypothetical protein VMV59_00830 [Candidatus Dormibacteraeota bacterium]|nr:hypothetical protein [Candidatus Dormibacteraeota bacterium]
MPESLNSLIEIHDSVLTAVETQAKQVKLSIEAYIHKSAGVPGVDPGTGWIQNVILTIEDGSFEGNTQSFPCDLMDGTLQINEEFMENEIPIPLDRYGQIVLSLVPKWSGDRLVARGTGIYLERLGEARYIEDVDFSKPRARATNGKVEPLDH